MGLLGKQVYPKGYQRFESSRFRFGREKAGLPQGITGSNPVPSASWEMGMAKIAKAIGVNIENLL